jgi:hypothetical protein
MLNRRDWLIGSLGLALAGCVTNEPTLRKSDSSSLLSKPKSAPNSMAVEFAKVLVPTYRRRILETMWDQVDQQIIDLEQRQRIIANGIRAGVAGQTLPLNLRSLMQPLPIAEDQLNDLQKQLLQAGLMSPEPVVMDHVRITLHPQQPRDLEVSGPRQELIWTWSTPQGQSRHRYETARTMLRLSGQPEAGSRIRFSALPYVLHGPMLPRYQADESRPFDVGVGQTETSFPEAGIELPMKLGETFLIGPTFQVGSVTETHLMGREFFHQTQPISGDWLILIRLIECRFDDLFHDDHSVSFDSSKTSDAR